MTTPSDASRYQHALERWRVLAERRLEHMTMLYETGRWRRYFSEERFLRIIRDSKAAVAHWQRLAPEQELAPEQRFAPAQGLVPEHRPGPEEEAPAPQVFALPEPVFVRTLPPPSPFEADAQRSVA